MARIALRLLVGRGSHFLVTLGGIAAVTTLVLLLLGIYQGAREGSTGYIRGCRADIWVCQSNSNNILRNSSLLQAALIEEIRTIPGVDSIALVLRILTTAQIRGRVVTLFLFGIDPTSTIALPPLAAGSKGPIADGELIVDRAFAMKHHIALGDSMTLQGRSFTIKAISSGTNAVLAQFSFSSLTDAQALLGYPGLTSFVLVQAGPGADPNTLPGEIERRLPGTKAYLKEEFMENTIREMETGVMPILWAIAVLGTIVGAVIVTLLLYGSVIERRQDYALVKALGSETQDLFSLVLWQAVIVAGLGNLLGVIAAWLLSPAFDYLVPEISPVITWPFVGIAGITNLAIACAGAAAPLYKLTQIDPEEVFRS